MHQLGIVGVAVWHFGCVLFFLYQLETVLGDVGRPLEASNNICRQLMTMEEKDFEFPKRVVVDPSLKFPNPRLRNAYIALQAWKSAISSDPSNVTGNWVGANVCSYNGVFCAPALDNSSIQVVAGIDLNHADIAGYLPQELGLLTDLALFHVNTNRFCGIVPHSFRKLRLLFELDMSNNRFVGPFPNVFISLPSLKYLDIRFNDFEGQLPSQLFDKNLDAIFVNNNRFQFDIPSNLGSSPVSVVVLANNQLKGCLPSSIGNMAATLNEIIVLNNNLSACLPSEIGLLTSVTVFDVSFNKFVGTLPISIGGMVSLEQLNVAHNMLSGLIPQIICALPNLINFTYSYNFFTGEAPSCLALPSRGVVFNDRSNCIPGRPAQRSFRQCASFLSRPVDCSSFRCNAFPSPTQRSPALPSHHLLFIIILILHPCIIHILPFIIILIFHHLQKMIPIQ
ncbi:leucine-rich repeat extensin-like protein 4 [Cryptomeria japonica]|uniref:leucine-rich repeat extensin-like protein 4 n=1 Tax=Cryptomeria japonica TaxID=3369 RepID=UPI0027DA79F1|nr:leucine-rich repeat extensin-like protein 4 [Cryptomeria japonica]